MSSKGPGAMSEENDGTSALVPRLRFPQFSEAWRADRVGQITEIFKGKGIAKSDISNDGIHSCIRYGELYTVYGELVTKVLSRTSLPATELFFGEPNDVIIPSSGETKEDIATAACVVPGGIAFGGDLNVLRTKENGAFLSYYLNGPLRKNIARVAQGDSVVHLYPHQIEKLLIIVPVRNEQKKIADCLSSLDELITAETQKLDALKTHKKGLMQQLFPHEGETVPRLRFPEFRDAGELETLPMGSLLVRNPEYGVNAPAAPYSEDRPTYLRITDIDDDGRFLCESKVSVDIVATDDNYLETGDIVLARTGASVGKSYRYRKEDGRLVFAGFLIRIRPEPEKINPILLANFLTTQQYWDWVGVTSARSGQPGINGTEYSSLLVPVPSSDGAGKGQFEQQKIADCLSALDDLIAAQGQKIAALKTHKRGLMQQLFPVLDEVSE